MKKIIKKLINYLITFFLKILFSFNVGRYLIESIQKKIKLLKYNVEYNGNIYSFFTPNRLNFLRAQTFLTKEPETIEWIKNFQNDTVFWDIGANVGLYSCFASKEKRIVTYAFEPSFFNVEILAKNIILNNLSNKVIIIPISLTDKSKISDFNMSNIEEGGSMSTFSENYTHTGKLLKTNFSYKTIGLNGDHFVQKLNLEFPNYIKIDVDGIEHLILKGFDKVFDNVKSILIEVNDQFEMQKQNVKKILEDRGFELESKKQSKIIASSKMNFDVYNQIWHKKK